MSAQLDEVALKRLRNRRVLDESDFLLAYASLMTGEQLDDGTLVYLLSRAVLFLRSDDSNLNKLGYRIVLQHALGSGDYRPLYEVASAKDYVPVLDAIERLGAAPSDSSISRALLDANRVNFTLESSEGNTVRTRGQLELRAFSRSADFAVVVAPTSYGKSEMMRELIHDALGDSTAILVPTKSLIAQTRNALIRDPVIRNSNLRVITHPESFVENKPFVAVMTQERLFRLLREQPSLVFHLVMVDEAHNLLVGERRAEQASEVLLTASHRSASTRVLFFTPFMANPEALLHVGVTRSLDSKESREHVKVERYYFTNLASGRLFLYDQFLKRSFQMATGLPSTEVGALRMLAGSKNLVYLNRPRHAQEVAAEIAVGLPLIETAKIKAAQKAIKDHVHPQYGLIDTLSRGVVFHHGGMPEMIRLYVEQLFSDTAADAPKFMVSTSTLLEGVNTPADTLFVLNPVKGRRSHLSAAQFRNLAGRVGRFREIFGNPQPRLELLQPKVYVMDGEHAPRGFNALTFLANVADVEADPTEIPRNPLLDSVEPTDRRRELLERLENLEPGVTGFRGMRVLSTAIGREALAHGADEYDLFENEIELARRLERWAINESQIDKPGALIEAIYQVFLKDLPLDERKSASLKRVADSEKARAFYAMFIDWRTRGLSLREMVGREMAYFREQGTTPVYVGSTWGDTAFGGGWNLAWAIPSEKSESELATLAVAKVKEEQEFIDYFLMRYVETFKALGVLEERFYYRVKYGTDDQDLIICLQNGISIELARLLLESYSDFINLDHAEKSVVVLAGLADLMGLNGENEILVFEATRLT